MRHLGKRILGLTILALATVAVAQQPQQAPPPVNVSKVTDNVYWAVGGAGSNNGIIVGKTGVILVDAKTSVASSNDVAAEIAKITSLPVTTAIITHSDADHTNGLPAFPMGITVIAQENCKKEMEASESGPPNRAAPKDYLPTKTYDKTDKMVIDGVRIELYHWAPGHTSGDTVVFLPEQKVVFAGDLLVTNRPDVLIHAEKNGSAAGWIQNAKGILSLKADIFVPGHGDLMTREDVQKKLDLVQGKYDKIKEMVAQGKSLDEIKTSFGEPTTTPAPNPNFPPAKTLTEVIYNEVTHKT